MSKLKCSKLLIGTFLLVLVSLLAGCQGVGSGGGQGQGQGGEDTMAETTAASGNVQALVGAMAQVQTESQALANAGDLTNADAMAQLRTSVQAFADALAQVSLRMNVLLLSSQTKVL